MHKNSIKISLALATAAFVSVSVSVPVCAQITSAQNKVRRRLKPKVGLRKLDTRNLGTWKEVACPVRDRKVGIRAGKRKVDPRAGNEEANGPCFSRVPPRVGSRVGVRVGERVGARAGVRVGKRALPRVGERFGTERLGTKVDVRVGGRVGGRVGKRALPQPKLNSKPKQ